MLIGLWVMILLMMCMQLRTHIFFALITLSLYTRKKTFHQAHKNRRFILLIPAHNEELGLPIALQSYAALDYPRELFEIWVIADNCSDQTAAVAQAHGAKVVERFHETQRSKGFALEYAFALIEKEQHPPDAVVIVDADTIVDRNILAAFAARLDLGQDWIQAYYTVANPEVSSRTRLLRYALALFNGSWLAGQESLGLGAAFRGNGMCLSWRGLQRCPWQAYGLAEDLEYSWHLRLAGEKVYFAPEVAVYGEMLSDGGAGAKAQRLRWEHGRQQLKERFSRQLATHSSTFLHKELLRADLFMPPLSRFFAKLSLPTLFLLIALSLGGVKESPTCLALTGYIVLVWLFFLFYLLSPFARGYLSMRNIGDLAYAPIYLIWKMSLRGARAPKDWVRTERRN